MSDTNADLLAALLCPSCHSQGPHYVGAQDGFVECPQCRTPFPDPELSYEWGVRWPANEEHKEALEPCDDEEQARQIYEQYRSAGLELVRWPVWRGAPVAVVTA